MENHGRDLGFVGERREYPQEDFFARRQPPTGRDMDPTGPVQAAGILSADKAQQTIQALAGETRNVDPTTGGEKGSKLARFDLIPTRALWLLAEVYGRGARKYADRNWEKGYAWGLSIAALERHFNAWKSGESIDEETGAHHLAQVAWHAFTLLTFSLFGRGTDDRSALREKKAPEQGEAKAVCGTASEQWKHPEWAPALPPPNKGGASRIACGRLRLDEGTPQALGLEGSWQLFAERERY
mgnify:CR=1 FL=1